MSQPKKFASKQDPQNKVDKTDNKEKITHTENDKNSRDTNFTLRKTKKTGNYSIMRCIRKATRDKQAVYEKVKYKIYGGLLPFGVEEYNENIIVNVVIEKDNNMNYNTIGTFNRIVKTFDMLKDNENMCEKYGLSKKNFFSFMKEIKEKNEESDEEIGNEEYEQTKKQNKKNKNNGTEKYNIRLYLRYGAKITHSKKVGVVPHDQLKGRRCNIDIELGSMWINSTTNLYGINIFITHITVLN
jgi:hypothetical protein